MRALLIDDAARAKVAEVEEFAFKNWYRPGKSETIPGDDERHLVMLNTYRCVFSYTLSPQDNLWRHLSISVPSEHYPNPFIVYTIAELFGFTGWNGQNVAPAPPGWRVAINETERCIVLAQPVPKK